jgi:hypothetical protein
MCATTALARWRRSHRISSMCGTAIGLRRWRRGAMYLNNLRETPEVQKTRESLANRESAWQRAKSVI